MDDFYRRHLNRIANSDEARGLMQMISVAVDAYSDYFARYGVTAIIESDWSVCGLAYRQTQVARRGR
jgi:hypothetical protein